MESTSDESPSPPQDLSTSQITIPSDSEPFSSLSPPSSSPPQSSNNHGEQPVIMYQPPTVWSLLRGAAINLLLPFVNGMMLGFGELLAHEFAFRLGWSTQNVSCQHGVCRFGNTFVKLTLFRYGLVLETADLLVLVLKSVMILSNVVAEIARSIQTCRVQRH